MQRPKNKDDFQKSIANFRADKREMSELKLLALTTKYCRPGTDFTGQIVEAVKGKIIDQDFLVVSEKAISTALNNIADESTIEPGLAARWIAGFWTKTIWGYVLGPLCHFRPKLLFQLRNYPLDLGKRHKQLALSQVGVLQALLFGSEGGIDGSNLPYTYVSLPLNRASHIAEEIRSRILSETGRQVCVVISDTDKTYSFKNFHFTPRPKPLKGIHSLGGFLSFAVGRAFNLQKRSTPLAVAGCTVSAEMALRVSECANRARGFGSGRTVWDMAEAFNVSLSNVTWEMLDTVRHKPIVIVRKKR
jgi:F420-0:gamma-glutamyl ligase-like protein